MNLRLIRLAMGWLGVAGVGITSWLSVKCSKKAEKETDPKKKLLAYAPAIASGVATSFCIMKPLYMADKEIAALAAGCAYMATNKNKLALPGTKAAEKEKESADRTEVAPWESPSVEWTGKGTLLCFEGYSGRLFYSSRAAVEEAEQKFNDRFAEGEYLSLNDLYKLFGISETHFGEQYGWAANSDYYDGPIEFRNTETVTEHGEKMLVIEIFTYPMECWMEV